MGAPPVIVAVMGPPGVGKTTLVRSLVRRYTKTTMPHVTGPVTVVSGKLRRLTFVECPNDIGGTVDLAKVADLVVVMIDGSFGFGGEESAGASFLRRDGSTWTTDKDGILLALLASEILAATGRTPSEHYADLVAEHGAPAYARVDAAATREQKAALAALSPEDVTATSLAGEEITGKLTEAPGNGAAIGGLKVTTESAWFAARPSGTEDVYKIYAESFRGPDHLAEVQAEAKQVVSAALGS